MSLQQEPKEDAEIDQVFFIVVAMTLGAGSLWYMLGGVIKCVC